MQSKIEAVRYMRDDEGFWLRIRLPLDQVKQTMNWLAAMEPTKTYAVELKQHRERRSLDANAYCWVLIGKLAEKLNQGRDNVYRALVRDIGGNYDTVCVKAEAVESLCSGWERHGLGWITERFPSKLEGCINVNLYYGSSVYDTSQMSRLIDAIIAECKENGIETATPLELERLKEEWR